MIPLFNYHFPSKFKNEYSNAKLISSTSYYRVYEAVSRTSQKVTIRIFDTEAEIVKLNDKSYEKYATLFIQEMLRLCARSGDQDMILIESFVIEEKKIAFATKRSNSLQHYFQEEKKQQIKIEKLLSDVISDLAFLRKEMLLGDLLIDPDHISYVEECDLFFLGDWATGNLIDNGSMYDGLNQTTSKRLASKYAAPELLNNTDVLIRSRNYSLDICSCSELYSLGLIALECCGIESRKIADLQGVKDDENFDLLLKTTLLKLPESSQKLLSVMLSRSPIKRGAALEILGYTKIIPNEISSNNMMLGRNSISSILHLNNKIFQREFSKIIAEACMEHER